MMEEIESILNMMQITDYTIQSDHWVHITHIVTPDDFYVRPTQYKILIDNFERKQPKTKINSWDINDMVVFEMEKSDNNVVKYGRGRVIHKYDFGNTQKFGIFAFDYGKFYKEVEKEYIWDYHDEISILPPLALHCKLANCATFGGKDWSKESIDAFKYYIGNERAKMIILDRTHDTFVVELINTCPDDIATLMALTGYSHMGYVPNVISRMPTLQPKRHYYTYKKIHNEEIFHVRVLSVNSHETFYVASMIDYNNFLKESDSIHTFARHESPLQKNELHENLLVCLLNEQNIYERGIVKEVIIPGTKALVQLVDCGREEEAYAVNMKPIPKQLLHIPISTIYCKTQEKQLINIGVYKLVPGIEFIIQIKFLGNELSSPYGVDILPLPETSSKNYHSRNNP